MRSLAHGFRSPLLRTTFCYSIVRYRKLRELCLELVPWVIPCEMYALHFDFPEPIGNISVRQPDVKPLCKIHIRPTCFELIEKGEPVRAGKQVRVEELDVLLTPPEL